MTNKKSLKRALILNVLSTLLCVSMLLGTTFAWFTDTVESGVNQIVAGNLDVELYHTNSTVTTAETVQGATNLFQIAKWEPGAVVYENFLVKNLGDLALKYKLSLNIADFNSVTDTTGTYDLRSALKVAIVPGGFTGTRDDAAALTTYTTLADFEKIGTLLTTGASDTYGVVIYWQPTANDNNYNVNNAKVVNQSGGGVTADQANNRLFIKFGVNVVATQYTEESDSFDNTYDESVAITLVPTSGAATFTVQPTLSTEEDKTTTVEFAENSLESGKTVTLTVDTHDIEEASTGNFTISQGTNNAAVGAIDLNLKDEEGNSLFSDNNGTGLAIITTYTAKNLADVVLSYDGAAFTIQEAANDVDAAGEYFYDPTTGLLVFATNHFSTYVVDSTSIVYIKESNTAYDTLYAAIESANTEKITVLLLNSVSGVSNKNYEIASTNDIVFDLNGHTMNTVAPDGNTAYAIENLGNLTIKDNTDKNKDGTGKGKLELNALDPDTLDIPGYASNVITNRGTLVIESGWIHNASSNGMAAFAIDNDSRATGTDNKLIVNGGKITTAAALSIRQCVLTGSNSDVIINGGVVGSYWIQNYGNTTTSAKGTLTINNVEALYGYRLDLGYSIDYSWNVKGENIIVNINGGNFKSLTVYAKNNAKTDIVQGGKFTNNVSAYCKEGYFAKEVNGKYEVRSISQATSEDFVAYVNGQGYLDFESAKAASNGEAIKLNKDLRGYLMFNDGGTYVLDLNGHNIANYSGSGNSDTINVYNNSTLTITDSSIGTKGIISSEVGVAIWTGSPATDTSSITINGGVELIGSTHSIQSSGGTTTIIINNAVITGDFDINDGSTLTDNR